VKTYYKVLLLEDDPLDADLTQRELKQIPLANEVVHFDTAEAALAWLHAAEKPEVAVILMDLNMPGMSGIQFLQQIKSNPILARIPAVVITSSQEDPDIQTCYELGVNAYVTKPVKRQDFKEAIRVMGLFWALVNQPPRQSESKQGFDPPQT